MRETVSESPKGCRSLSDLSRSSMDVAQRGALIRIQTCRGLPCSMIGFLQDPVALWARDHSTELQTVEGREREKHQSVPVPSSEFQFVSQGS